MNHSFLFEWTLSYYEQKLQIHGKPNNFNLIRLMPKFLKIVIYVPFSHADLIRKALAEAGAGKIGNYDYCSFSLKGIGRFRGLKGANPAIGKVGNIEEVEEERIETILKSEDLDRILRAIKKVHPYEEPAIDIYPLLN